MRNTKQAKTRRQNGLFRSALLLAFATSISVFTAEAETIDTQTIDLASDSAWVLSIDGGANRPIVVPGGGWNSDVQEPRIQEMDDVKDYVTYKRTLTIPAAAKGKVVELEFGGVNYGCEITLDGQKVGEHHGPMLPFSFDLTGIAKPGTECQLEVKAYHRRHYIPGFKDFKFKNKYGSMEYDGRRAIVPVGWDFPKSNDPVIKRETKFLSGPWEGWSKHPYGITKYVKLHIRPQVYVDDVYVRTSVTRDELEYDVSIRNASKRDLDLSINSALSSWNQQDWKYPSLPTTALTIPAGETKTVTIGPIKWGLGQESYWWPNIPFREDYKTQLHFLDLTVNDGKTQLFTKQSRFGFVEHAEGEFYYTVNGVRYTGFSDGTAESQMSDYDGYSRTAAFLPPTKPGTGCPETWRRYLRLGINMNRLHCSPPTKYMLETADEIGFMLIPEAPIWGNMYSSYHDEYTPQSIRELGMLCRQHPSVARYSLANELRGSLEPWRPMIDTMTETDPTRPLTFELHKMGGPGKLMGIKKGHAWKMEHYTGVGPINGLIRGHGEFLSGGNLMKRLPGEVIHMRLNDWAYMAPWSILNYWPNFLEGTSYKTLAWRRIHRDRTDGVDGWGSPEVQAVQRAHHPYLMVDRGPKKATLRGGEEIESKVEVFNGGLFGDAMELAWELRWDDPTGEKAGEGSLRFTLAPGFHAEKSIRFTCPESETDRQLYLVKIARLDGQEVNRDETLSFSVKRAYTLLSSAEFMKEDRKTQGDWNETYGQLGYEVCGNKIELPEDVKTQWRNSKAYVWKARTAEKRGLWFFVNDFTGADARIAACRYAGNGAQDMVLEIDTGEQECDLSLYFMDYDRKGRKQTITVTPLGQNVKGSAVKREISDFGDGLYLTYRIQGAVKVTVSGNHAPCISGVFFDKAADSL